MPKRTRLSKKSNHGKTDRLRSAIREEVKQMSRVQLMDFSKAKKSVLDVDPLLATYKEVADLELARRKAKRALWGKEPPVQPRGSALTAIVEAPAKFVGRTLDFYKDIAQGKFAEDVVFGVDYIVDKVSEVWHRKDLAVKRWRDFRKAHGLLKKTENDYLREGYSLKRRYKLDVKPVLFKRAVSNYRSGYKSVVIVPSKVNGDMSYSMFVKGVR